MGISNDHNFTVESLSGNEDTSMCSSASTLTAEEEQAIVCDIGQNSVEVSDILQNDDGIEQGSGRGRGQGNSRARRQGSSRGRGQGSSRGRGQSSRGRGQSSRGRGQRSQGRGQRSSQGRGRGGSEDRRQGSSQGRGRGGRGRGQGSNRIRNRGNNQATEDDAWIWKSELDDSTRSPLPSFVGNLPGPKGEAVGVRSQLECFLLFLSGDAYDEILTQSNLYAEQQRVANNDNSPWSPITKEELMAFIGVVVAMGVVQLPAVDNYWSIDPILTHPWFRSVFTRLRFRQILRYLHVADNSKALQRSDPNYDKLWKVRYLINALSSKCLELYNPHPQISIDESMIGTKCRLSFIQYLPKKPVKWGIKVWVCADSVNGYIYTFDVYCGANSTNVSASSNGVAYDVVFKLAQPCLRMGYTVYMDNFYSSPLLYKDLLAAGTTATGTVRCTRKNFPSCLKEKSNESRGATKFAYHNNITVVKWHDITWNNKFGYSRFYSIFA